MRSLRIPSWNLQCASSAKSETPAGSPDGDMCITFGVQMIDRNFSKKVILKSQK